MFTKIFVATVMTSFMVSSFAQPIIQATDLNPTIGESITIVQFDPSSQISPISPGSSGSNVTWNFSEILGDQIAEMTILGSDANFPTTNQTHSFLFESGTATKEYVEITQNGRMQHGIEYMYPVAFPADDILFDYSNAEKQLEFPLSMSTNYTDSYICTFLMNGVIPCTKFGEMEVEVDGFGTIITPAGTYTDVLRIHIEYTDTIISGMGTTVMNHTTYSWYKAGIHFPVFTFSDNAEMPSYGGLFYLGANLSVDEMNVTDLSIYPNPIGNDLFSIACDEKINNLVIHDVMGKIVYQISNPNTSELSIQCANFATGSYVVLIKTESGKMIRSKIVK